MNEQKQPAVAGPVEPTVRPSTLAAFVEALHGRRGELDAWLECNNEAEVRAHVLALVKAEREKIEANLRAALAQQAEPVCPHIVSTKEGTHHCALAALAQPEQEPVAWRYKPMVGSPWSMSDDGYYISCKRDKGYTVEPLYARPLGPHPDTVRLAYLYSGTQTSSDALVNAEMKLLNGKTLTLEEARAAIDDAMSKPMKY